MHTKVNDEFLAVCVNSKNGCGDAIINYPPKPVCTDGGYTGLNVINPSLKCPGLLYPPTPSCESKYYTGSFPPTDPNAYTKCESTALLAKDNKGELACARLLPDTPENAFTKCESEALVQGLIK